MKTLTTVKAWILICSVLSVSSATEHPSSQHDVSHHGDSTPKKNLQNSIVPFGIQIPEHVLSTQDVACISADSNIFEIMNKAQESCNGTDMRCTFYHFVNHGYKNIGTLDVDKELFDDLLLKFDNWLLTAENIEKNDEPLDRKTKEDPFLDTASINVNGNYSNEEQIENSTYVSETEDVHNIGNVDHNTHDSDDDKIVNTHHIKNVYGTHHRNHHHKSKNGNHITLVPEYNNDHKYFEVFLSKDKETGKPRTIYVEVDKDENKFVLLDEEIEKKLNGIKPIKIELDELSEIADTAFNDIAKSSNHKQHIYNSNDGDRIMANDVNTYSAIDEDTTNLDKDVRETTQNILNPFIFNINTNQQLIPHNTTANVKKTVKVSKNLVAPNKYTHQAKFDVESQLNSTTDEIPNDHLVLLESSNNETDIYQTGFDEEAPLDTIEFNENNTNIDLKLDNIEYSPENVLILYNSNSTENYELSTEHDNVTFYDDSFIQPEENNDTSIDIDFDDTHDFSTFETTHLNEPISQTEKHVQENKPTSTPTIYTESKLTPSPTTGMSDYNTSQLDAIPSENRQGYIDLKEHSPGPGIPLSSYTNVPIMGKDLAKVVETDDHLQSFFPVYATLDLPTGASQKTPLDSDFEHPSISSYNYPLDSGYGQQTTGPEIFQHTSPIFPTPHIESAAPNFQYTSSVIPSPPVECVVRLNKGSKYSPLNFGFSWLPSFSRIEELRLPCAVNASPQESILQLSVQQNKQLTDSICPEPSSLDHTIPAEDPRLFHTVTPLSVDGQKPSLTTVPYHLEANVPMPPKHVLPTTLDLPKSFTDSGRISTNHELSETPLSVKPYSLKDSVNSPCPMQQIEPFLPPTKPNLMDLGLIKHSPFDNNSKETMIPYTNNRNRYPYTPTPCFANPYLRPPQIIPPYLEPLLHVTPLQPASKMLTLDSLPTSLDQSYPYINGDYRQETNYPISLLPNSPFPPLSPLLLGPGLVSNTLPCQNLWNNIPNLPCSILPDQNIRNYPPIVSNYLTPSAILQQNQILKPLLSKSVPLTALEQPCPIKNVLAKTPLSYTPFLTPVQMDLNPSLALERDLQSLSLKYGIPLSKILNSLETEISDAHSKTTGPTCKLPYSNLVHNSFPTSKPTSTKTNAAFDDENRSSYRESLLESELSNLTPLDSSLIGPHLELESSLILESNDSQSHTVLSESTSSHSRFENQPTNTIHDSSLIGPHLTTLSTSNFVLSEENRTANGVILSESDISNSILLDSSLIGPHLEVGSPPIVLDSNNSHSDILASQTVEPITVSSQIEQKLNLNRPNFLDSYLIGSHLPPLSPVRPLLSNEIQNINDMIPLETDLTALTPLHSSVIGTQEGLVNQLDLTGILQHEETGVTLSAANASPDVHKPLEYLPTNLVQEELLLESDFSKLIPLDSSLIGPEFKLGSLPIITDSLEDKTVPLVSKDSTLKTDIKVDELENIILPPSLLPTLLKKTVKADVNLNINTQDTKLNEELDELSVDTNVELKDISMKETGFKILEQIPELPSLINEIEPLLTKDPKTFKHKSKPSDITHVVDSETILDSSLTGTSILHKLETPEISTSLDSSIHLDSSLIGPSILQAIDSREISYILDSESSLAPTTLNQNKKPSDILTVTDSAIELQSSFKETLGGSHLLTVPFSSDEIQMINKELQSKSDLANLVPLDSSLIGPYVDFESELEQSEISRYHKPESSLTSANPEVSETTEFLSSDLVNGVSPLEPITVPSVCASDLEELLSKFTNAITKAQLSPSELKPCDKLLSSIAKISSDNYVLPTCKDLQTLTLNTLLNTPLSLQDELASEFSPITLTYPAQEFSPVESIANGLDSNDFPTPTTMVETRPYTQEVPRIPITPYSPCVQMKQLTDRNWLGPTNIQNILQSSPNFWPVEGNAPVPLISNALISEDLKSLLDLASYSKNYPQLSIPTMYTAGDAIAPSLEWNKSSYVLPLDKYIPVFPKKSYSVLPSHKKSAIANVEYNPIVVDDIMSQLDENSFQLLKDMSILPYSQSSLPPTIPVLQKGEIVSPSLLENMPILDSDFIQTRPVLPIPITNPLVPSSIYNPKIRLNNLQNLPYMTQTQNYIPPCNLQPYSNTPLHSRFSEIIEPAPNFVALPTESSKARLQQLLSKPCLKSPIIPPSSSLGTMLQLPTAPNESNSVPSKLPPEYFTPISPIYKTQLSNAFTSPILPIYASPLSVSFAKPDSPPSTSIPLNTPYVDSPLTRIPLSINPCTAKPLTPKYPYSPVMPLKITPISDYPQPPLIVPHNRPIPSKIPYSPSHTYSNPYLPVHPSSIPTGTSPGSPKTMSKLPAAMTSLISPVFYEPLLTPYVSPVPKSLTNLELPAYSSPLTPISLSKLAPTSTGLLSPAHLSLTNSYPSLPAPMNTQTRPSNVFTPASISPVSSSLSSSIPLSLNPKIITPEIKSRQLNTLPISNAVHPLLNANQWLPINSNIPIQKYPTQVSKLLPSSFSNSQIKQYIPNEHALESNLLTSPLTEEIPSYDVIEESAYTYINDKDEKYYAEPSLKYPLESLSYTLAPEEIAETLPPEDFIKLEDLTPFTTVNNRATVPSLQTKSNQNHLLTPYTPVHGEPLSKPRPVPQLLPLPPLIDAIPQSIFDSIPLVPSSNPLKHPISLPISILSSPLLKPLTPLTFAPNFPITSALLPRPCIDSLYNKLPMNEKVQPLSSSPYYSTPSQDMPVPPIYPTGIRNIASPQVTPGFSQVPTNTPFVPVSSQMGLPKSQPPNSPSILDSYVQLPLTYYKPKSKTLTPQGSLVEPLPTPSNTQLAAPVISYISPLEMPISSQYITPLSPPQNWKIKPLFSPQYMSSILPAQTTLQYSLPLKEAPIHYQPHIDQPTTLTSSIKSIFKSPPVTSPYTVLPSMNMFEPVSTDLSRLSSNSTPQHSLPSLPLPVSKHSPIISYSNHPSRISPHISKQALTNQIIPSSLFMSSDTSLQTPTNKLSSPYNIPRYGSPSPLLTDPLETVPYYTLLDTTGNQQNILKPISSLSNIQYTDPLSSQPLQPTDFYQTIPGSNVQFTTKPRPNLSSVPAQYASPSSAPIYTSLPLKTVPYRQINKFGTPQYSLPCAPIYDSPIDSSSLTRNPFLNPDYKTITEVPSYPVPKNIISPSKLTPSESILLSNLRPLDISQDPFESYFPFTSVPPLSSSYLLKPLAKRLPQKSRQYQPHIIPSNLQYVSQLPIESVPELIQSACPLLKSSLLKPLSINSQNNARLIPMRFSNTNTALPEDFPIEAVPSVTSPDITLSNYLPSESSNHKYSGPYDSLASEIPDIVTPINPSSTTPYSFLKSQFNKHFKSPEATLANMPLYSNYDILDPSPKLPVRANLVNTAKPVEVSATSALESSPLFLDSLDTEIIEEIEPYELMPGLKDRFSALPIGLDQQRHLRPASTSKYLATPQPTKTLPFSKYKTSRPRPSFFIPSLIPEEAELIDTTNFGSLSQIKSEPLIADYTPSDRKATKPNTPSNIAEPDILQLSPYTTLLNTDFPFHTYKELPPKLKTPRYCNQIVQPSPTYLSPQEYKELIQGPSPSQASSSSSTALSPTNTEPQPVTNPLTGRPRPQVPFYNPMSITPDNWFQSPTFIEITPEKDSIQTLLNKYKPANNLTLQVNNYPYEPKSTIPEVPLERDSTKPVNPLLKSKEPYTEHMEDLKSNEDNYNEPDLDDVSLDEKQPNSFESKSFTKTLPDIINGLSIPNYNYQAQRPQKLSKLDHFYADNHIGKGSQVYTVPTYNTLPFNPPTGVKSPSSEVSPEILKDFTDIPIKHFGSVPQLDTISLPSEYYPEITDSPENIQNTNSYPQNYLNPYLKYTSEMKSPDKAIEIADTFEMTPISNTPYNNIDDIKYSGYKTYQIPSFESPQTPHNLGTPTRMFSPSEVTYSTPIPTVKPLKVHEIPSLSNFYSTSETKPLIPQYQTPTKMAIPLQTKLGLGSLQESPELNEYNPIEDIPMSVDNINEDNELKTSLINYINKGQDVKNNLINNNAEITIPIGNVAITRKEPYNANTIETNNPSIGLRVWKSNVKIAEAELKLKFKDLSVNNFMPIVNNLDKYDMEEIRKIIKRYIDEKYGNHIEINEPYIIDNRYTVIKDFDHNAVGNKYNLLWPTDYV